MASSLGDGVIPGDELYFEGVVHDIRLTRAGWQRLEVATLDDIDGHARAGALILTYLSPEYRVEIGQRLLLGGDLHQLEGRRNPGAYNEFMVQRARGIAGKFYARTAEAFEVELNIARASHIIRNRLALVYNTVLPHREAGLIQSIILGERPDMDDPVVEMYRMAGIYHLLVVSGLHLSILMMATCLVLEKFLNRRAAGLLALALMIAYTILTGAGISTVRAVTMAGVTVFGRVLYRDRDALSSVSFACILLLLYEPLYLFSIGFQLSFATVFGLVLLTGPMERALALLGVPPYRKLRPFLAYNIVATISTYPVLAYHFSYIATYSILVNLVIAPTAVMLVIAGLLVGLFGLLSIDIAFFLAGAVYYLLRFYEAVMRFFLALPASTILAGNWGPYVTYVTLTLMLIFAYAFSGYGRDFQKRLKLLWLCLIILTGLIALETAEKRRFALTSLDVGEGDSYVFSAGAASFVVDGGGNNRLLGTNTGATVLIPYLDHRGILKVDGAFASDSSRSRITGLIELAEANRAAAIYIPSTLDTDHGLGMRLRLAAERNDIPIYSLSVGDTITAGPLTIITIGETPRLQLQVKYRDYVILVP